MIFHDFTNDLHRWASKKRIITCADRAGHPILEYYVYPHHYSHVGHTKCFCRFFSGFYGAIGWYITNIITFLVHSSYHQITFKIDYSHYSFDFYILNSYN